MRNLAILMSATALAACGGEGATSVSSASSATPVTPTPAAVHSFVSPTEVRTYDAPGAVQSYEYTYTEGVSYQKTKVLDTAGNPVLDSSGNFTYAVNTGTRQLNSTVQAGQLYKADAATVRNPGISVSYDPRNAQYTLKISQNGLTDNIVFQDPAHRTDFSGARTPQQGVPNLEAADPSTRLTKGVQYLEVDSGSNGQTYDASTFFYEKPGTTTKYVTYAGFVRNHYDPIIESVTSDTARAQTALLTRKTKFERAAFVFGEPTSITAIPKTGTGSFTGNMIASMVSADFDYDPAQGTYFQWLKGSATVDVNFATNAVKTSLSGTLSNVLYDASPLKPATLAPGFAYDHEAATLPVGATFSASSTGSINLVGNGGFTGTFDSAQFVDGPDTLKMTIAGSTLDGAFYGPTAQEVGASFRIVGAIPDQRIDIIGSFTGVKKP